MEYLADIAPEFVQAIKEVENNLHSAKKRGEYKQVNGEWKWFPGKSPEGGLPTLAWGHKITPKEWEQNRIYYTDEKLNQQVFKDFRYGMTDAQVEQILKDDLKKAEDLAKSDWNKYNLKKPYDDLPIKYKGVLVNLVFNAGPLAKKGKFVWTTVQRGILAGDDLTVAKGMVTSYKRPDGVRVRLTTRAIRIAKGLGLPSNIT